jgi:hypothetical protein
MIAFELSLSKLYLLSWANDQQITGQVSKNVFKVMRKNSVEQSQPAHSPLMDNPWEARKGDSGLADADLAVGGG